MTSLKELSSGRLRDASHLHADKLAQTKLVEKSQRQAHKQQLQQKKAEKEQERRAEAAAVRRIRALNGNSKRAKVDARRAAKKEAHAATGATCEHGIWRCSICFPHPTGRK